MPTHAMAVIAIWGVILAVRTLRTPEAVLLQAAGEFRALAGASTLGQPDLARRDAGVCCSPSARLPRCGGILAGDLVMTVNIFALTRRWRLRHG